MCLNRWDKQAAVRHTYWELSGNCANNNTSLTHAACSLFHMMGMHKIQTQCESTDNLNMPLIYVPSVWLLCSDSGTTFVTLDYHDGCH